MKIVIENVSDGESIPHNVILIRGRVDNLDSSLLQEENDKWPKESYPILPGPGPKRLFVAIKTDENGQFSLVDCIRLCTDGKFKLLLQLTPGMNWLNFEFCRVTRNIQLFCASRFAQVEQSHKIKLVYIVSPDSNGEFQVLNGLGSQSSAVKRISLAGSLVQCFLSDSLDAHGLGRKTIQFCNNCGESQPVSDELYPSVFLLHSKLPSTEAHLMSQNELWTHYAKELLNHFEDPEDIKYLAITNVTKYDNAQGAKITDFDQVLSLTKGHVALGGGRLALFGSGCLYSWPEKLVDVSSAFQNDTAVDANYIMDDSGYRGTYGGCFASTLGAIIHELGHTLDLGHTESGIMARGFDDMDKFFTCSPAPMANQGCKDSRRNSLRFCGAVPRVVSPSMENGGLKTIKGNGNGSNILEEYQKRKYYRKMVQDCGGAYWSRSCALILSCHKWLNADAKLEESLLEYDHRTKTVMSEHEDGICVVELRDFDGTVVQFQEPEFSESTGKKLHKLILTSDFCPNEILATDYAGNILKANL